MNTKQIDTKKAEQSQIEESKPASGLSRRRFMQLASVTGAGLAISKWAPSALAATTSLSGTSFPPQFWTAGSPAEALSWSPESIPGAALFRARVPLARRIAPLAVTQAQPLLSSKPQLMNFEGHLPNLPYSNQYNDIYAQRAWQYHDVWGEFGGSDICPPQPAWTNAAHRNGVLSLGMWYGRGESWPSCYAKPDGSLYTAQDGTYTRLDGSRAVNFPLAAKMVEMADYYGFDGWFLDWETQPTMTSTDIPQMILFLQQLRLNRTKPLYVMMYDGVDNNGNMTNWQNEFNTTNDLWEQSGAADSFFANYWWYSSQEPATSAQTAESLKKDPFTTVYMGLDISDDALYPLQSQAPNAVPANGSAAPATSLALFNEWGLLHLADSTIGAHGTAIQTPSQYAALYALASQLYEGATGNPASANTSSYGVANFITERSVIGSLPFISRFNIGQGYQFFIDGAVSAPNPWYSIGIQDILPSWQWWVKDYYSASIPSGLLSVDFDLTSAYNGGSSLQVQGSLGADNATEIRLFKTHVEITGDTELKIVYKEGTSQAASKMQIGLIYADEPNRTIWLDVAAQTRQHSKTTTQDSQLNGWKTATLQLGDWRPRVLAAISLGFVDPKAKTEQSYQINIGELNLADSSCRTQAETPRGFSIEASQPSADGSSAQFYLSWQFDPSVWYYDIYAVVAPNGARQWLGRAYDECYYVDNFLRPANASSTQLQLVAVSKSGQESAPGKANFRWS